MIVKEDGTGFADFKFNAVKENDDEDEKKDEDAEVIVESVEVVDGEATSVDVLKNEDDTAKPDEVDPNSPVDGVEEVPTIGDLAKAIGEMNVSNEKEATCDAKAVNGEEEGPAVEAGQSGKKKTRRGTRGNVKTQYKKVLIKYYILP